MLKKLPLGLKIVLALALAAGAGLLALMLFLKNALEPEKLRVLAVKNAEKTLGRKVRLGGVNVGLMTGLTLDKLEISEYPDFTAGTFAAVESFELRILWKPILRRKVVVDHIAIKGLELSVSRGKKGTFNFDDLTAKESKDKKPSRSAASSAEAPLPFELDVKTASLSEGKVLYHDKTSGDRWHLSDVEAGADNVGLTKPFNAQMSLRFAQKGGAQPITGRVTYDGELDLSTGGNLKTRIKKLTAEASGFVVGSAGTVELDGANITADLDPVTIKGTGLAVTASAKLFVAGDTIDAALRRLDADISGMNVAFTAKLKADAKRISLPDLKGRLGDGELSASLNVSDYAAAPKVELKASLSRLDAAKLLAAMEGLNPAQKTEAPAKAPPSAAPKNTPAAASTPVKASGRLSVGELIYSKTTAKNLSLDWDLSGITPDFKGLTGWAKMRAAGGTYHNEPGPRSGMVKALLLPLNLLKNIASVGGAFKIMPDFDNIIFTELSGDYAFQNGLMTISDFHLYSSAADILAKGSIDLPAETLKLQVTASIANLAPLVADVGGTFDAPKIKLRLDKLLSKPIEQLTKPALNILKGLFQKN